MYTYTYIYITVMDIKHICKCKIYLNVQENKQIICVFILKDKQPNYITK